MKDTIYRQAAIDCVNRAVTKEAARWAIQELPSAEPEIIRCKDCKNSEHWYRDKLRCFLWHKTGIDVFEDGYCNYAERRTK